jgi:cysteine desulfurase
VTVESSIYLDNAATTRVDPAVADAMAECLGAGGEHANAASSHSAGRRARAVVERARDEIAARIGARSEEIVFTSGATESNHLALHGVLGASRGPSHLVTTRIEHPSVLETARALEAAGVEVTYLDGGPSGRVSAELVSGALRETTRLVSVMHVNNEIGTVQPVAEIAAACRARGVPLHVDAAQSVGKLPVDVAAVGVDLCALSAHTLHGPKGVGALFVRRGVGLAPVVHGGGQERGLRPGTLATHQVVGMGCAYRLADPSVDGPRLAALRDALREGLAALEGVRLNGGAGHLAPHIVNATFAGVEGESLRLALGDLVVSPGSACTSDDDAPSHVLWNLGLDDTAAQSSLRFSFGRFTTHSEVVRALERVAEALERLRALAPAAPAWCRSGRF